MSRFWAICLAFATLAFVASSAIFALQPTGGGGAAVADFDDALGLLSLPPHFPPDAMQISLSEMFLRPRDAGMAGFLVMTWVALVYVALRHLARLWRTAPRATNIETGAGAFPPMPRRDGAHATELSLILALMLGAIWPWLGTAHPAIAFLLSLAMLVCFLGAAFQGRDRPRGEASSTLGFVTGWALLACLSLFAATIERLASVPQTAAAVLVVLIAALVAIGLQLRLGRRIGLSLAVLWGLIGIAAGTVTQDVAVATAAVLGIAIIAVGLVRATT